MLTILSGQLRKWLTAKAVVADHADTIIKFISETTDEEFTRLTEAHSSLAAMLNNEAQIRGMKWNGSGVAEHDDPDAA